MLVPLRSLLAGEPDLDRIGADLHDFVALYYENVMRESSLLEEAAAVQREKAEQLRQAMLKAAEASDHKSIFLAKMSHELRTPLNAVIGYSEMLRDELREAPGWEQKATDLDRINAAGRHLIALVNDVLDLSHIESNDLHVQSEEIVVAALIDEVVATVAPLLKARDNRLNLEIGAEVDKVVADPLKLRQSLINLLSNAAKFTARGTISVTVGLRPSPNGEMLVIEVRDTGIGISPEGLQRLFQNFSQAERNTASQVRRDRPRARAHPPLLRIDGRYGPRRVRASASAPRSRSRFRPGRPASRRRAVRPSIMILRRSSRPAGERMPTGILMFLRQRSSAAAALAGLSAAGGTGR